MIFTVSNDGIEWSLDFGPDSVLITVKDLVQEMIMSSQEIPLQAWNLLLDQRQQFLDNHLARVPITPNQEGTWEMRDEVLSSVGAQPMDTSGYQLSDLEDIEFAWENPDMDLDAVYRPGVDTPFSPSLFDNLGWGSETNPIIVDEEEDKENEPPSTPTTSWRPNEPPPLRRSFDRDFGQQIENIPDTVYRDLFEN